MKSLTSMYFVFLGAFIFLSSCKKEAGTKIEDPVVPDPIEAGIYLPIKFEAADLNLDLHYKDNTALLTEITDANESKTIITYTAEQQPQKLEKYKNGKLIYIAYYEQANKQYTNKALTFSHQEKPSTYTPTGAYSLTYNDQQKISAVNYYNTSNQVIKTNHLTYSTSLNLAEMNTTDPANTITYTFDQKRGISSHIPHSDLFTCELDYWFLLCAGNNVLTALNQKLPEERVDFSYAYQENGYPSSMTITRNGIHQIIKITYKRLE